MTTDRNDQPFPTHELAHHAQDGQGDHAGHRWMMIACCIPMLALAVVLVVTGVAGAGALFAAIACTVMMALMMGGKSHGGGDNLRR
jgi:Flp pilus assembly protein TadB